MILEKYADNNDGGKPSGKLTIHSAVF